MNNAYIIGHGTAGPEVEKFERVLGKVMGLAGERVVATLSGTHALELAFMTLTAGNCAVPALTWNATANAVESVGGACIFVDVDNDGCMDPNDLQAVLNGFDVNAVMPVHLYGNQVDDRVIEWAKLHKKTVIVDASQGFELPISRAVDATCFSFHTLKSLPLGIGGAVIFQSRAAAREARSHRYHGIDTAPGTSRIQKMEGIKAAMPAPIAAMGTALLPFVDEWWLKRRAIAEYYNDHFKGKVMLLDRTKNNSWHAYIIRVADRYGVQQELKARGIDTAIYYVPLVAQPYWYAQRPRLCKLAMKIGNTALALPIFPDMMHEEVEYVVENVLEVVCSY